MGRGGASRLGGLFGSVVLLALGCGRGTIADGADTGSTSAPDGSGGGGTSHGGDTSTSPPGSGTKTTSDATSGSTDSGPVHGIWQGIYNNPGGDPYSGRFAPCGGSETWCIETNEPGYDCTNMFVEVEGELAPPPPGNQDCDSLMLTPMTTLEIRRCQEDDCDDPPAVLCQPELHACRHYFECDLVIQDCPGVERCVPVNATSDPALEWSGTACIPDTGGALGEGEACSLEEQEEPCAPVSMCWDPDPGATTGHCVKFCEAGSDCSGTCVPCPTKPWIALCRLDCDPPCDDGATCIG